MYNISHDQQRQRWMMEVSVPSDSSYVDPAGDSDSLPPGHGISLDDQIKAYEAMKAEQVRQARLFQEYQDQFLKLQAKNNNNNNSNNSRRRQRKVHFAEDALLYGSDRTREEVQRMWFNRDELNKFKQERKDIVRVLKKAKFDLVAIEQSGKYCLRGYEPYFSMEVNRAMKYARTLVINVVLTEQKRQQDAGYYDDEAIREGCESASQWARDNALQLGKNDELEVFGEYQDDCDMEPEPYYSNEDPYEPEEYNYNQNNHYCYQYNTEDAPFVDETSVSSYSTNEMIMSTCSSVYGNQYSRDIQDQSERTYQHGMDVDQQQPQQNHHQQQMDSNYMHEEDPIAERLDSALKLVQALKFGTSSNYNS